MYICILKGQNYPPNSPFWTKWQHNDTILTTNLQLCLLLSTEAYVKPLWHHFTRYKDEEFLVWKLARISPNSSNYDVTVTGKGDNYHLFSDFTTPRIILSHFISILRLHNELLQTIAYWEYFHKSWLSWRHYLSWLHVLGLINDFASGLFSFWWS